MKRTIPAVLIAASLALAGCASTAADQASTAAGAALPTATATASPAPIVIDDTPNAAPTESDADSEFIEAIKKGWTDAPTDEQLLAAGHSACDQLSSGADPASIVVVSGDSEAAQFWNRSLVQTAAQILCPAQFSKF